ncbi:histidine phosphatase family protein [Kineococcus glutinatus]|uniref:Histidine phosphatase family protein n=1 Tax=Kineococcus glutinatus TaxID=1070872 RepID=A0ABP9HT58_9ACTN
MRLVLARHGQTDSNVRHLLDTTVPGPSLTELGREQADALADLLAPQGPGCVVASSQTRAQQTAAPLARVLGLRVHVRDGLREIAAGEVEMRGDEASVRTYLEVVGAWLAGDLDRRMPGAEDGHEFFARYDAAVADAVDLAAAAGAGVLVVVSHGAAIRTWCGRRAANLDGRYVGATGLLNTGVVELDGDLAAGWVARTWMGAALDPARAVAAGAGPAGEPVPGPVS